MHSEYKSRFLQERNHFSDFLFSSRLVLDCSRSSGEHSVLWLLLMCSLSKKREHREEMWKSCLFTFWLILTYLRISICQATQKSCHLCPLLSELKCNFINLLIISNLVLFCCWFWLVGCFVYSTSQRQGPEAGRKTLSFKKYSSSNKSYFLPLAIQKSHGHFSFAGQFSEGSWKWNFYMSGMNFSSMTLSHYNQIREEFLCTAVFLSPLSYNPASYRYPVR